jgi:hypothetical protein
MTTSITLYETFTSIGIAPEQARAAVAAIAQERDARLDQKFAEIAATKVEMAAQESEFLRQQNNVIARLSDAENRVNKSISDFQRWLIAVVLASLAAAGIVQKWGAHT